MPSWELAEIRPLLPSGAEDAETFAHDNESLADTPSCSFSILMDALNSAGPAPRVIDRRLLFSSFNFQKSSNLGPWQIRETIF